MDEQRIDAYSELIQALLNCPEGQEGVLLQDNAELVDAGLVEVMGLVAQGMEEAGENNAGWLRQFAGQVAQALGWESASVVSQEMDRFVDEVMVQIARVNFDPRQVYEFWRANLAGFNEDFLAALPVAFQRLKAQNSPKLIAAVFGAFGSLIAQFPLGVRWLNLEMAITAYEKALNIYTRETFPKLWATMQNDLAAAYCDRIRGERADNLEQAIASCDQALGVSTRDAFPEQWAATQNNLALAYCDRIRGERVDNLEQAITAYQRALDVYTHDAFPEQWAMTQNNLALAYCDRIRGERADNLEQAIAAYQRALEVYTREAFPEQWAGTQNNLAGAYCDRIRGERAENLERAITTYERALEVRTRDAFPERWAETQNNLAAAYCDRIRGERTENLERAITAYERALEVRTRDAFPQDWATTQNNLAAAYYNRIRGEKAKNLERAIIACDRALEIHTHNAFPQDWAKTQNNLALVYRDRIRGERAENLERAIAACEQALEVYTRDAFPQDWAKTQNNLALVYCDRIRGEQAENLERAIAACEQALEVYTRDAFPQDWAKTQNNLALAYDGLALTDDDRIQGERAEYLERAIVAYERALQVRTRDAFPQDWAMTQNNLANAYSDRIRGERADNLEQAIAAYEQALEVLTRDAFPKLWATTQNNLAATYIERIRGERGENLERAIAAYERALEVYTRDAFPKECRMTSRSLGDLQAKLQNWPAAAEAHSQALAAAETLYNVCLLLDSRAAELKETADLPRRAAYAYAKIGQLDTAVATVERGRARGLTETLERDRADLQQLQQQRPDLYDRYRDITNQLRNLESLQRDRSLSDQRNELTPDVHRTTAQTLNQQIRETIEQIQQTPGYETFLKPTEFNNIQRDLPCDRPVVYLVTTPNGSLALIVTPDTIQELWLDDFTETQLIDRLNNAWLSAYRQSQTDRQSWLDAIATVTGQLWDTLMSPLIDRLKTQNHHRVTLIPTGYLSFLPLHAAWTHDDTKPTGQRYALDEINFTYTPNTQSLIAARAIADRHPNPDSILAIENPTGNMTYSQPPTTVALQSFPKTRRQHLQTDSATLEAVRDALPGEYAVVNFYCHGTANFNEPLTSGLLMNDGLLTLAQIFELNLTERDSGGIRLAILSACETGLPGIELADEAIGLPVGMMQAGVAAVVASLWSVSDLSTSLLLRKFYQLWRNHKLEPSEALRQAQIWLRDSTNGEIAAEFPDYEEEYIDDDDRDLAHPFHWSAFSYLGV